MKLLKPLALPTVRRRRQCAAANADLVAKTEDPAVVQLSRLNEVWAAVIERVPHYRDAFQQRQVPECFASLEEFRSLIAITRKADVRSDPAAFYLPGCDEPGKCFWWSTGGSTAEPFRFPKLYSEVRHSELAEWWLRSLIGIAPNDASFRLWGHSHILGSGFRRIVATADRRLKDAILGMTRVSAYDLSDAAISEGLATLLRSESLYGVGYTKAWEYYAEHIAADASTRAKLPAWKALIATAESFTSAAHRDVVERVFQTRVLMDYGTMETGPIAQEVTRGHYIVAWPQFLLEVVEADAGVQRVAVTALFERAFPLVRYELGDAIQGFDRKLGVTSFTEVLGRSNPVFLCPDGLQVHSEPISHVLREMPWVSRFQVGLRHSQIVDLLIVNKGNSPVDGADAEIRRRLAAVNASLAGIGIKMVTDVRKTAAGKRPAFIEAEQKNGAR